MKGARKTARPDHPAQRDMDGYTTKNATRLQFAIETANGGHSVQSYPVKIIRRHLQGQKGGVPSRATFQKLCIWLGQVEYPHTTKHHLMLTSSEDPSKIYLRTISRKACNCPSLSKSPWCHVWYLRHRFISTRSADVSLG